MSQPVASKSGIPHEVRTATEPRQTSLYPVRLSYIERVSSEVRLFRFELLSEDSTCSKFLYPPETFTFLPGQWVDLHIPTLHDAGGFTITSTPREASPGASEQPYIELAVQQSPNPAAKWLWLSEKEILGTEVQVRVGGSFVWPSPVTESHFPITDIRNIVFIAGAFILLYNPLISMISYIHDARSDLHPYTKVHLLYSTKLPSSVLESSYRAQDMLDHILFLPRLRHMVRLQQKEQQEGQNRGGQLHVKLYLTNISTVDVKGVEDELLGDVCLYDRRISVADIHDLVSTVSNERGKTVCNICGPPEMTDTYVDVLKGVFGDDKVFFEKWW
ncbi:hypothetical protein LOZ53_002698 [Ophidiomyces ophidiicola]|nr:hypothetical protein LOZ55_003052 [Ophidiomyces ophidiicola]KAI1988593.1 hypothetical protein LOZ51_005410 [Ophidiomyces ophidiicola]KAI1991982.1 hypothetical protein LOZ53_002698 [Ophidiomyces ophidiicola]KAI1992139.1 hypothetical protein LOZ54_001897 [Ophidiomyces ophidiicola]